MVDSKVSLVGLSIFGAWETSDSKRDVTIEVFHDNTCVLEDNQVFISNGCGYSPDQINFSSPIHIEANQQYEIAVALNGIQPTSGYGQRISNKIKSAGPNPITVSFSQSPKDTVGGGNYELFHSLIFNKSNH